MSIVFERSALRLLLVVLISILAGCAKQSRYHVEQDYGPAVAVDVSHVPDAVPQWEPYSRGANKPYKVLGKHYNVLPTSNDFRQQGIASWYGHKFHGHLTSNGETYDMYAMTAAHKTLPIPCYVKVTNKDNGRSVIVRVNDRGPFHEGRVIDLSYAAASKLGYVDKGTANVYIEAINFDEPSRYIQVGAFGSKNNAVNFQRSWQQKIGLKWRIVKLNGIYKVQTGPYSSDEQAKSMAKRLESNGLSKPLIVFDKLD